MDAAFLLTAGSFPLTVELFLLTVDKFSFFAHNWSFFAYNFSFFAHSWSFFPYSGKVRLIRALRDCKQRSLTVSKKAPTVSKEAPPLFKEVRVFKVKFEAKFHLARFPVSRIGARQKGDSKWEKPVSAKSAVSCENLRVPAVFCANLRLPNPLIYRASRKSAKICENVRSESGFSLLLSPFPKEPGRIKNTTTY